MNSALALSNQVTMVTFPQLWMEWVGCVGESWRQGMGALSHWGVPRKKWRVGWVHECLDLSCVQDSVVTGIWAWSPVQVRVRAGTNRSNRLSGGWQRIPTERTGRGIPRLDMWPAPRCFPDVWTHSRGPPRGLGGTSGPTLPAGTCWECEGPIAAVPTPRPCTWARTPGTCPGAPSGVAVALRSLVVLASGHLSSFRAQGSSSDFAFGFCPITRVCRAGNALTWLLSRTWPGADARSPLGLLLF